MLSIPQHRYPSVTINHSRYNAQDNIGEVALIELINSVKNGGDKTEIYTTVLSLIMDNYASLSLNRDNYFLHLPIPLATAIVVLIATNKKGNTLCIFPSDIQKELDMVMAFASTSIQKDLAKYIENIGLASLLTDGVALYNEHFFPNITLNTNTFAVPEDVRFLINKNCSYGDNVSLSRTCTQFYNDYHSNKVWKYRLLDNLPTQEKLKKYKSIGKNEKNLFFDDLQSRTESFLFSDDKGRTEVPKLFPLLSIKLQKDVANGVLSIDEANQKLGKARDTLLSLRSSKKLEEKEFYFLQHNVILDLTQSVKLLPSQRAYYYVRREFLNKHLADGDLTIETLLHHPEQKKFIERLFLLSLVFDCGLLTMKKFLEYPLHTFDNLVYNLCHHHHFFQEIIQFNVLSLLQLIELPKIKKGAISCLSLHCVLKAIERGEVTWKQVIHAGNNDPQLWKEIGRIAGTKKESSDDDLKGGQWLKQLLEKKEKNHLYGKLFGKAFSG